MNFPFGVWESISDKYIVAMIDSDVADFLLFAIVNTTNILTVFVFVSRVKWPSIEHIIAIANVVMAIPTIVVVVLNAMAYRDWVYRVMPSVFIAWAILALFVDIILKIEFRQPRNAKILVPFLLLFYIGLIGMGILTWRMGLVFWVITAATFVLQLGATAYAFRHGKG